ncbi:uclacyanin 1-like [Fagus crenata]
MTMLSTLMSLAISAMLIKLAMAANYTVGGTSGGWDTSTNLQTWASSQSFLVGDNLIFQYAPSHDVAEVSKADYDSCQASNTIQSYSGGTTTIPLSSPGKRHFICGTVGHCSQGMKVEINTLATSSAPPTPSPSIQPPASSVTPLDVPTPAPEESHASSPTQTPESTPILLPPSPSDSSLDGPSSSPSFTPSTDQSESHQTSSSGSSAESPSSSSAHNKSGFLVNITMGFVFVMMMLKAYY